MKKFEEVEIDEDDVSAEQPLAQEDAWLPRAHEDERWPSCLEEETRKGNKETFGIRKLSLATHRSLRWPFFM